MATTEDLEARIRSEYPSFVYLLNIPEVKQLLLDAVNPDIGFSPEEFQARLQATTWYRSTSDAARSWDALVGSDPESARRRRDEQISELQDRLGQMGVPELTFDKLYGIAEFSLRNGLALDSAEMRNVYANLIPTQPGTMGVGTFADIVSQVKNMAREVYMVGVSDTDAWAMARQVALGNTTMEGIEQTFATNAKGKYAHLATLIDQGIAPGTYFAPYRQLVAQEMDLGSEAVDLMDPKWADMLSKADGNAVRAMTLGEAQQFVRSKDEWRSTTTAQQMGSSMANELLRTFGAIA